MSLTIHIGAHKTASSLFQGVMRRNEVMLENAGISCMVDSVKNKAYRTEFVPRYRALIKEAISGNGLSGHSDELGELSTILSQMVDALPQAARVVSDERLLGPMPGYTSTLYPGAEYAAEFIERVFGDQSPRILLYIREQAQFLESVYLQYFRENGAKLSFDDFFRSLDLEQFSWRRVVAPFAERFGADMVTVRSYDADVRADHLVEIFLSEIGFSGTVAPPKKRVNARFSHRAMEIFGQAHPHLEPRERFRLQLRLKSLYPVGQCPPPELFNDEQSKMLKDLFSEENATIVNSYGNTAQVAANRG